MDTGPVRMEEDVEMSVAEIAQLIDNLKSIDLEVCKANIAKCNCGFIAVDLKTGAGSVEVGSECCPHCDRPGASADEG